MCARAEPIRGVDLPAFIKVALYTGINRVEHRVPVGPTFFEPKHVRHLDQRLDAIILSSLETIDCFVEELPVESVRLIWEGLVT